MIDKIKQLKRSIVFGDGNEEYNECTCTVGELIEFLQQFPSDLPVLATWEGVIRGLGHNPSEIDKVFKEGKDALIIDAEGIYG